MSKTVLISAGHGAGDPGAVGHGYKEADIAVRFRDKIARALRLGGFSVLTDGADGINEPLTKACALARTVPGRAVELHLNAGPEAATGIEALCDPKYRPFAQALCSAVAGPTGLKLRGDGGWKDQSSGQHHRLGFCQAGGVILELCFISRKADLDALFAHENAVVDGLVRVLAAKAKG